MSVRYYPLVNRFISSLQLNDRDVDSKAKKTSFFDQPFITIAREPGSGGAPVAKAVAKKLGFVFVDKQIIEKVAKSTKKRKEVIKQIDEKERTAMSDMIHSIFNKDYVSDIKYLTEMTKVVMAYAHKGRVVILGRGANFITPMAKGLHVSITAPYATRVKRAMDYEGFSRTQAKEVISNVEKTRRAFVKQYLKRDSKKANAYDLTLNTAYLSVDQSRDIIVEAFCNKFSRFKRYGSLFKTAVSQ
ncbi:MAG: cytidylate kinase-like family protein [Patescibacteria group bacterium]